MKTVFTKILLAVLPFMAAILATTGDSVRIVNTLTGEMTTASYFEVLPSGSLQMAPHMAGICAVLAIAFAAIFLGAKKDWALKWTKWASFCGACFAVLPMFVKGETLMVPNVGVPILLMLEFLLAAAAKKMDLRSEKQKHGPRLDPHI